ncbi:MAG: prolipoprotein diacylglyceryl transferase [Bacillota bacterium]
MDRVAFNLGPIPIMWYAIFIVSGILLGLAVVTWLGKDKGYDLDTWIDFLLFGLPLGLVGARLYFVLFNLSYYLSEPGEILNFRSGGLAIHGGLIVGLIYTYFFIKKKDLSFLQTIDILAPAFVLGQSIGRWGNFFNQEAYGRAVDPETLAWLPEFIQEGMLINGTYYQPTFLYESIWNFFIFIILIIFIKSKVYKPGQALAIYLAGYSLGRFVIEDLRADSLYLGDIQVARLVSIILILAAGALFYYASRRGEEKINDR